MKRPAVLLRMLVEEAKKIVEDAHKEAESIIASSRKSADELTENTKSELKLFAGRGCECFKIGNSHYGD